jgi:hypothetical protein
MRIHDSRLHATLLTAIGLLSCAEAVAAIPRNYEIVSQSGTGTQRPTCPGSKKVLGGGATVPSFGFFHESRPETDGTGWRATAQDNVFLYAYAICADVDSSYEITSASGGGAQHPTCTGSKKVTGGGAYVPSFRFLHDDRPETDGGPLPYGDAVSQKVRRGAALDTPVRHRPVGALDVDPDPGMGIHQFDLGDRSLQVDRVVLVKRRGK